MANGVPPPAPDPTTPSFNAPGVEEDRFLPRSSWIKLSLLVPVAVVALVAYSVRLPYFVISPGPAQDVQPLIQVEDHRVYPFKGRFLLTSVYLRQANVYEAVAGWVDPTKSVVPEREVLAPGQTQEEELEVARSEMDTSKIDAALVALTDYAGYPESHRSGALVERVFPGTPAEGELFAGDVVVAIDGAEIDGPEQVSRVIAEAGAGTALTLTVRPLGETKTHEVTLRPAIVAGVDRPVIGVNMVPNFPFGIEIQSGEIGGPSAGLMWTLGLVDLLTPGDLTDGRTIAGTGEIFPSGEVGPVGGIEQKVEAAEQAGAVVFFTPARNLEQARSVADSIELVAVDSYQDAVDYLEGG